MYHFTMDGPKSEKHRLVIAGGSDRWSADSPSDYKINEGKRILKDFVTSGPNHPDGDWLRQMVDWGVALVCSVPPTRLEERALGAKSALNVPRPSTNILKPSNKSGWN